MEENTTVYSFSDNTSIGFDVNNMNNNTTNGVPAGNLFIRLLATSHIMFKIGEYDLFITGRNEVVAKVIFLHLSVILFTGGGCVCSGGVWSQGVSGPRGMSGPGAPGGFCSCGGVWSQGVLVPGGSGLGSVCSQEGIPQFFF